MKKIFTSLSMILLSVAMYAATEPAWYNDVQSITANGEYYIYSVNGKGFMQAGKSTVQAISESNYTNISSYKFKISKAEKGYVTNGNYYLKSYMVLGGSGSGSGPVCTSKSDDGTEIIWTIMNGGEYWNIHGFYNAWLADRYPALKYQSGAYEGYMNGSGINYSKTKDTQTAAEFRWLLVSQAQIDRHFAIFAWDKYIETVSISEYNGQVPAAYYAAMEALYTKTFSVQDENVTPEQIEAARTELNDLLANATLVTAAFAEAKATINALEGIKDKGEDFTQITADIQNARTQIEQAKSVAELKAATSAPALKQIDPITFNKTTFEALSFVTGAASTPAGRKITYKAKDANIINADGKAIYKGTTKLTATAAATDKYYKFVRTADVTVTAEPTTAQETKTITYGDQVTWNGYDLSTYPVGQHTLIFETLNEVGAQLTITLTLTVNKMPKLSVAVPIEFCQGGSQLYRGKIYTEAGTDVIEVTGATRDTVFNVTVTVNMPSYVEQTITVQVGQPVQFEGEGWLIRGETPVVGDEYPTVKADTANLWFVRYGTTVKGCDEVEKMFVKIELFDPYELEKDLDFCEGETVEYHGKPYSEQGTFTETLEGLIRDTLLTVNVTVFPKSYEEQTMTLAAGDVLTLPEGEWMLGEETVSNEYETSEDDVPELVFVQTGETGEGCEAIKKLIVTVTSREGFDNIRSAEKAQKVMIDGVLYIRRGNRLFTAEGHEVK